MKTESVWRRGRTAGTVAAAAMVAAVVAVLILTTGAGGSSGSYTVRAIFDDAANLTSGEVVKVDEVQVGTIGELTVTPQGKAAIALNISNPGFRDFREDAHCEIIPQSLLGEKYVNCTPTQPRPEGTPLPPPLKQIPSGREGEGQYLLPLSNTSSPVGPDQLQDITRLPMSQRLRIILNELGATFAGRGKELNEVIRRANPGLRELDKVLGMFAQQNRLLANLAVEGDRALAPLSANREHFASFIDRSNMVAKATARHLAALKEDLAQFPEFLRQLGPATERIQSFAEQTKPTFEYLGTAAPAIDRIFRSLGPFSKSSDIYFKSLGKTGKKTGPALQASKPLLNDLQALGSEIEPFASNASTLLSSLRDSGGLERIMDFIFLGTGATNGYDALGHFLRAEAVASSCLGYKLEPGSGCSANFIGGGSTASAAGAKATATAKMSMVMARTLAVLEGMTPAEAIAKYPQAEGDEGVGGGSGSVSGPVGGANSGTTYYDPGSEPSGISEQLLEYLLGS